MYVGLVTAVSSAVIGTIRGIMGMRKAIKEYEEYEREVMEADILSFSKENDLDSNKVLNIVNNYFVDENSLTKEKVRQEITDLKLPLLKQTQLVNKIIMFVKDMYNKFTAEGV